MRSLWRNRLALQLLLTIVAAISLTVLSALLVSQALSGAESVVYRDAEHAAHAALAELHNQGEYRVASDNGWAALTQDARDLSLTAVTTTVLRAFDGVEGGFAIAGILSGYSYPTHDTGQLKTDLPSAERPLIQSVVARAVKTRSRATQLVRGRNNLLVLAAVPSSASGNAEWVMKRVPYRAADFRHNLLLIVLILAALLSITGALLTGINLVLGVRQIQAGLVRLESDFMHQLPPRQDEFGSIIYSINRMAAARRTLEAELRREDRLLAVGRLAAGLAHEIRNPLNSISLSVQLLDQRLANGTLRREQLTTVRKEVDRLNTLLTDLLSLHRPSELQQLQAPLLPVLEHCVGVVEPQIVAKGANIQLQVTPSNLSAWFDARRLTQAVVNLLLNAADVCSAGHTVRVTAQPAGDEVQISVYDQGPGLQSEALEHLFEPLWTSKATGTGLGLAVSRELLRSQAGDLHYQASGEGACFTIQLRASPARTAATPALANSSVTQEVSPWQPQS